MRDIRTRIVLGAAVLLSGLVRFYTLFYKCNSCSPSWQWYYPFHYAPFASDLVNIDTFQVSFELSEPFNPTEQLLAVLPSDSSHALPESCRWLMTDPESPIIDLYNSDVPLDPNGKHLPWLWVLLLPFVEDRRIVEAFRRCETSMNEVEKRRNKFGHSLIFIHSSHPLASSITSRLSYDCAENTENNLNSSFNAVEGQGIAGSLKLPESRWYAPVNQKILSPYKQIRSDDINSNLVMCYGYAFPISNKHQSKLLDGAIPPPRVLTIDDIGVRKYPKLNKGR